MTIIESKPYRRLQVIGSISVAALFFIGTYLLNTSGNWYLWDIITVITISLVMLLLRAAKMEVLTNLGITLPVYERLLAKQGARRGKK